MPCPNCDRTLAGLVDAPEGQRKFHCQYCGVLVLESGTHRDVTVPTLIREPRWIPAVQELVDAATEALKAQGTKQHDNVCSFHLGDDCDCWMGRLHKAIAALKGVQS